LGFGHEFDPFLRSPLWTEPNEMSLSVLSALARLDLDPWGEAATLAGLPRARASLRLATVLIDLPGLAQSPQDLALYCERSVALLPASTLALADLQAARPAAGHYVAGTLFLLAAALSAVGLFMALAPDPAIRAAPAVPHAGASAERRSELFRGGKAP
jgi:hypothetical protein